MKKLISWRMLYGCYSSFSKLIYSDIYGNWKGDLVIRSCQLKAQYSVNSFILQTIICNITLPKILDCLGL